MFALTTATTAKLTSMTPRIERHGDENVPAVSLGLAITGPNTLLDLFSDSLRHALYKAADDAGDNLPGIDAPTPLLRTRGLERIKLKAHDMVGYRVSIAHGIDDNSAIDLHDCKVDKWSLEPFEGGSVCLSFRVGTSDVDEAYFGALSMMQQQEVELTIRPPEPKPDAIDGTQAAFDADHPEAGDLFAAEHGQTLRDGDERPEDGEEGRAPGYEDETSDATN
jgi:hypothetical protein